MERLLTTQEVADRLAVDKKTVLRYLRAGKLTGSRIGRDYRIPEGAVSALLRRTNPATPVDRSAMVMAVVNQKGGVGKTTTTFNLGVALQRRGRRVLLVDLDPQAALSASAGVPIAHLTASIYQALLDENVDPIPIIRTTVSGVDIQPATIDLAAAEVELVNMTLRELVLRDVLAKLRPRYDHILIDLDPQAALSASAGIPIAHLTASVYQTLLDEKVDPVPIIRETLSGVDILPATIDLAAAEVELVNMTLRELVLRDVVEKLRLRYDHILIDCPPSLGLLTINALAAADRVIIPLQCEYLATRGLTLLLKTLEKVQARLNRDLRIEGILPTMFDGRTTHANEILAELRTSFPGQVFETVIRNAVRVKESPAAGLSIFDYDPNHDVAKAYVRLAQEVDHA